MARVNVPDEMFRQTLIDTVYSLCVEYMDLRARAAEIKIHHGEHDKSYILKRGKAAGIIQSAKTIERDFTGDVTSCTFMETKVENMLAREDQTVAIREMYQLVKQARGY